jgi:hypothetical protein
MEVNMEFLLSSEIQPVVSTRGVFKIYYGPLDEIARDIVHEDDNAFIRNGALFIEGCRDYGYFTSETYPELFSQPRVAAMVAAARQKWTRRHSLSQTVTVLETGGEFPPWQYDEDEE